MGLFDALTAQTPQGEQLRAGLLGMGAGLLSGSTGNYGQFAPAFGRGLAGFAAGTQNAALMQQRQQEQAHQQMVQQVRLAKLQQEANQEREAADFFAKPGSVEMSLVDRARQAIGHSNPAVREWGLKIASSPLVKESNKRTQFDPNTGLLIDLDSGSASPVQTPGGAYQPKDKWQFDPVRGVRVNTDSGIAVPIIGDDGKPLLPQNTLDKPLNEGQSKDLLFGSRAAESDKIIGDLTSKVNLWTAHATKDGVLRNAAAPADVQRFNQAKRDFINAVLRKESGAVISQEEFANAEVQYFPQPGDSDAVIKQKARNRQLATQGILSSVPTDKRDSLTQTQGGTQLGQSNPVDRGALEAEARRRGLIP